MQILNKKILYYSLLLLIASSITLIVFNQSQQARSPIGSHSLIFIDEPNYSSFSNLPISRIHQPVLHSDEIVWEKAPSLIVNDSGYAHVYNGKIYFVGGSAVQEFDTSRGTWIVVNNQGLGYNPYRGGSALIGDRLYMVHGWTAEKTSYYDIGDNIFGNFTPANYNRLDVAVAALDGILYVSGGWKVGSSGKTVAAYDLQNDTWYFIESMGTARDHHEMVAVGGYLYAIGGITAKECPVERYDPTTKKWEYLGNGPGWEEFGATVIDDDKIIVGSSIHPQIYLINEGKWYQGPKSNLSLIELHRVAAVGANSLAILDNYVYSIGGRDAPGNYYDYVWRTEIIIPPAIDHPRDIVYEEGTIGHVITWNAVDDNPAYYNVSKNGELIFNEAWYSESVNISVDGLSAGKHELQCIVVDQDGHYINDSVLVTVIDNTPPTIDHPEDLTFEEGSTGHVITWYPFDNNPESYVITKNVMVVKSGSWNGSVITISLDNLSAGNYSFVCEVFDTSENSIHDIVIVTVTSTGKVSSSPWTINFLIFVICFAVVTKRAIKVKKP